MARKFQRFEDFCDASGLNAFPAHPSSIYSFIRFLREENSISPRSLPQYLAAISMTHQARGLLSFTAFDQVTRRLARAWLQQEPDRRRPIRDVPLSLICSILELGLSTDDVSTLRACCSAVIDFVFFIRAISGHCLLPSDVRVVGRQVIFVERRTKRSNVNAPALRTRTFDNRGVPEFPVLIARWVDVRQAAFHAAGIPCSHFWLLPGEPAPSSRTVSRWFSDLLAAHPALSQESFCHHDLWAGRASSCFSLQALEGCIRN